MTVNETSFFRDSRPFELLRTELLPKLIAARRKTRTLRLWSAACSTGQETYSLAMLIRENFHLLSGWKIHVEGSDISKSMVERARAGIYERIEVNRGLPARYLARYFERVGERWEVKPEIRAMCRFRQMNLCDIPMPFSQRFDVILMRNVMLYLGPAVAAGGDGGSASAAGLGRGADHGGDGTAGRQGDVAGGDCGGGVLFPAEIAVSL